MARRDRDSFYESERRWQCEPSPEDQGWHRQEQKTRAPPGQGQGAEHRSLGLGLSRALLHSVQSGKVQIGLEVIGNHPAWPLAHAHARSGEAGALTSPGWQALCCPQAVVPFGVSSASTVKAAEKQVLYPQEAGLSDSVAPLGVSCSHLRGSERGVEQQGGPDPVELGQSQLPVLSRDPWGRLRLRPGHSPRGHLATAPSGGLCRPPSHVAGSVLRF